MTEPLRVLWVVNLILPAFAESKKLPCSEREGWLSGLYQAVQSSARLRGATGITAAAPRGTQPLPDPPALTLGIAYPMPAGSCVPRKEDWDGATWYSFPEDLSRPERYDEALETVFREILEDFRPDMVHIFGTEFPHALACLKAFGRRTRSLLGIQGFCQDIADRYMAGLPEEVRHAATFRDRLRQDSLAAQQEKFRLRAAHEREAIALAGHITGRTAYDRQATGEINPARTYHAMNETLRPVFYEGPLWSRQRAVPHRIFLPQGDYPLKGFHYLLEALALLLPDYPDATLAVAGNPVTVGGRRWIPRALTIGAYGRYLRRLMAKHGLAPHVEILGRLTAERMRAEMLRSDVFALPSELENSPNSMGEAMLLGMPAVCSRTGGIPSLLAEGREGLLADPGDVEGLAACIRQLWEEPVIASVYGENARKRALLTHDPDRNLARLFDIYREIVAA